MIRLLEDDKLTKTFFMNQMMVFIREREVVEIELD